MVVMLVARAVLRFRDGYLNPGDEVPPESGRDYGPWIEAGLMEEVPDPVGETAPPAPEPVVASEPVAVEVDGETLDPVAASGYECPECGKMLPSEHGLKVHKSRVHWRP